ncbi:SDR family NAD(P)-dependent oxidoreductase [Mycobacterium paraseoulense]|uniref:Short-chain dehydrogenase n=1 Tax=Mycobacterium paraseoulense TaxID=590652 RepID=A0A1X0I8E8_9MYCO|nr:SDR family oxidoreductase [Mycobacterium paraseoulense]MCV7393980.1 SDR family oxidoreductase [Mycobacterium paraseoulense]ORB38408.1 hypothetical protein BST39_17455 [Mycobacterium paraseoulense]BBZ70388.1 alcohol dehydrogenase [Mycobacterium paraseoulense]
MSQISIEGKVTIVFGGTNGIGADICRYFGREGATVVVTGRNVERGEQVTKDITAAGGTGIFIRTDIGVEVQVQSAVEETVSRFGRLDAIVNNAAPTDVAAAGGDVPIAYQTAENFESMIRVGIWGLFHCCKHAINAMVKTGGGSIVNISSAAGVTGVAGLATYAMTKGAMNALTRSVAVDFGSQSVRSNAIIVGNVPVSDIVQFLANHPVAGPELLGVNSIPRLGVGDDIAAAAAFLVSDASAWITGSLMAVDGGYTARAPISDLSAALADYQAAQGA